MLLKALSRGCHEAELRDTARCDCPSSCTKPCIQHWTIPRSLLKDHMREPNFRVSFLTSQTGAVHDGYALADMAMDPSLVTR